MFLCALYVCVRLGGLFGGYNWQIRKMFYNLNRVRCYSIFGRTKNENILNEHFFVSLIQYMLKK